MMTLQVVLSGCHVEQVHGPFPPLPLALKNMEHGGHMWEYIVDCFRPNGKCSTQPCPADVCDMICCCMQLSAQYHDIFLKCYAIALRIQYYTMTCYGIQ